MAAPKHLVAVWNPAYGTDVMETHITVLRELAQKFRSGTVGEDDVYVWWGKIRSTRRQEALPHLPVILALEKELGSEDGDAEVEMHLYLTDYRSLYVAHIGCVTADDPRDDEGTEHVPEIYRSDEINCDCWFQLWDIRRLVSDDTLAVVEELGKLRNTGYHDMPVSIYGGMVNLPLVVTRPDAARYFEPDARDLMTGGCYWVEFDAEHSGIGATERELREHCFGEEEWFRLDPAARTFVATAEKLYRDHKSDISFDPSPVLIDIAKAFEVQTNIILRQALTGARLKDDRINIDGKSIDVVRGGPFMLGDLARIIADSKEINDILKLRLVNGAWFCASLPPILKQLSAHRNPAAHSGRPSKQVVQQVRNQSLGVGCEGDLVKLAKVRLA